MARRDDGRKSDNSSGTGAVLLIVCLLVIVSFIGDGHPLDRMADIVMIITWCMAIGFLIFVALFGFAYYFQTAIMDLYESTLEDMEHSRIKEKLIDFRAFLENYVFNGFKKKSDATGENSGSDGNKTEKAEDKSKNFIERLKELKTRSSQYLEKKQDKENREKIDENDYRAFEEDVLKEIEKDKKRKR